MRLYRYTLLVIIVFSCNILHAQVGISVMQVSPLGDMGQFYSKGPGISVFASFDEDNWRGRAGLSYAQLRPRIDTVPQYLVKLDGSNTVIVPGYLVNDKMTMISIFIDYDYRVLKVKQLGLYLGGGVMVGKAHMAYVRDFEAVLHEQADRDVLMGGFKGNSMLNYKIGKHINIYGEAAITLAETKDHTSMSHYTLGLGFDYTFKP